MAGQKKENCMAIDFTTDFGRKIEGRLTQEQIIWLTTVDSRLTPQPRPVWFDWDGQNVLIFSQAQGAKLRHIRNNRRVALNFNTDAEGGEVGVLIGEAVVSKEPLSPERIQAYLQKYAQGIRDIGLTPESMLAEYSAVILVTPQQVRGF
jgi:PPOX class probable F420-dependent enzyme